MDITNMDFGRATAEDICLLIDNTLSGNNEKIAYATKLLKAYTKHKASIKILTFILMNATNPSHRQMSTVLLRRNLVNLFCSLDEPAKAEFKNILLTQYINEKMLSIQRGIANLIGLLLPVVELKNWPDLQSLLGQAIKSDPHSVATFVLLNCLLYHFKAPKELNNYLFNALKVPNLVDEAIKCVTAVAETQEVDQTLAIELIKLWEQSNWPQDISLQCLGVMNTLAERRVKMNEQIVEWICNHIVVNKKLSPKFRVSGLDFLSTYTEFSGKTLASKQKLLRKVVQSVCLVCSEPFSQEKEEGELNEPIQQIALWLIETMSVSLKSKKIYPILLQASTSLINSDDVNKSNTGFLLLGGMAEGCAEKLKKNLQNPVMNVLIPKGLNHAAPEVRGAAINALSYFSEYLIPDIVDYHAQIIPSMMAYVGDASTKVAEKALIAVDVFFENMEEDDIKNYLPTVIPRLSEVLLAEKSTPIMRNAAMSGIGSAIQASGVSFQPFAENVYAMCVQILKTPPSPQLNAVRAQNATVLGKLANIFCKKDYANHEQFYRNYVFPIMEIVYIMLSTESDPEVRESCFMFFYLIANATGSQFDVVFDKIIPEVFKSAVLKVPEKKNEKKDFSLDSDSEDDDQILTSTKAAEYDEKAAAIRAMGELANACPMKFVPFFDQAYVILDEHHQFFYDSVRSEVSNCYVNIIKGYIKSQNNGVLPVYTNGLPVTQRYPEHLQNLFKTMLIPRMIFMTEDQNRRPASVAIEALDDIIKSIGPVIVDRSIDNITQALIQLFESQVAEEDDEEEEEDDEEDTDAYIFEPLCQDLIPTLCEVLQNGFLPSLSELQPYMCKFLEQRENINDNVQMVGCLSQCFKFVPSFFSAHHKEFFQLLASLSALNDADLNRNIAYCFAEVLEKCPNEMKNYLEHTLLILKNIYDHQDSHQACKDNALAAICKSIIVFNPPMPYELFVNNLIQSMPFKGDEEEEGVALRCLIHLTQVNPALIQPHAGNLISIIENDLKQAKKYKLEGEIFTLVSNYLRALKGQ